MSIKSLRTSRTKIKSKPVEDVILFTVQKNKFAIAAKAVDEIRSMEGIEPVRKSPRSTTSKVKYALPRTIKGQESVHFVVDAAQHYNIADNHERLYARIMVLRNSHAAVLVDNAERMTRIESVISLPLAFHGAERVWYRGLAVIDGEVVPVVEPSSFLNMEQEAVLRADWLTARSTATAGIVKTVHA